MVYAFQERSFFWNLIIAWFVMPFIGLGILVHVLPLSNGRYVQVVPYISAAVLASLTLSKWWKKSIRLGINSMVYWTTIVLVFIVASGPAFYSSIKRQQKYAGLNATNYSVYVPEPTFPALDFLNNHGMNGEVVLSYGHLNSLIPVYTNKRVVYGHPTFTYNPQEKEYGASTVFTMGDVDFSKSFLEQNNVKYIMLSSPHPAFDGYVGGCGFEEIYNKRDVVIWKKSNVQ